MFTNAKTLCILQMTKNVSIFLSMKENSFKFYEIMNQNNLTSQCQQKSKSALGNRFKLEPQKNSNVRHITSDLSTSTNFEKELFCFLATKLTFKFA